MQQVDLMIFDFDGTLVNSGEDIAASVNYTLEMLGYPRKKSLEIINYIGDGAQQLIEQALGHGFENRIHEAMAIFSSYYADHMLDNTHLYDSVINVLCHYKEKKKIIITNKRKYYTDMIAKAFGLTDYFEEIIGADSTAYKKPDSRLMYPILKRYSAAPDKTVVVGDGVNDILFAKNAGVLSCALLNGLTNKEALLPLYPDYVCEDIAAIKKLFV